jgi:hypothetical protein
MVGGQEDGGINGRKQRVRINNIDWGIRQSNG